jgi:hypothetical protein
MADAVTTSLGDHHPHAHLAVLHVTQLLRACSAERVGGVKVNGALPTIGATRDRQVAQLAAAEVAAAASRGGV